MVELQGVIQSLLSIEQKYESPYEVNPLEGHTYIHGGLLHQDAAGNLVVNKAIS